MKITFGFWLALWLIVLILGLIISNFRTVKDDKSTIDKYLEIIKSYENTVKIYQKAIRDYEEVIASYKGQNERLIKLAGEPCPVCENKEGENEKN